MSVGGDSLDGDKRTDSVFSAARVNLLIRFYSFKRVGVQHCGQCILDEVGNDRNGFPYISSLNGFRHFLFRSVSSRDWVLRWQDAIRQLLKCVFFYQSLP